MRIGLIGAGAMAEALGGRWAATGHELMITSRTVARAELLAARLGARTGSVPEVAAFADVVLLGVLHDDMPAALESIGDELRGKTIIDCNNPVEVERFTLTSTPGESMAQQIARSTGGHVVKAFNLCWSGVWELDPPVFDGRLLAVPYCADEPAAAAAASTLIADLGAHPLPVGDLRQAHHLEAMAAVIIKLLNSGHSPYTVFNLVDRPAPPTPEPVTTS
jgi:8-hydroxy-5-deazaflavin:NADPH oxidoreductase